MGWRLFIELLLVFAGSMAAVAQDRFRGELVLPGLSTGWEVGFERDRDGLRLSPRSEPDRVNRDRLIFRLSDDPETAVGVSAPCGKHDLSRFREIHVWVRADANLRVRPYTQSSGYVFRDAGSQDVEVPARADPVLLRIPGESMADSTMVQCLGVQVRSGRRSVHASLEIVAVTVLPEETGGASPVFAITGVNAPSTGAFYRTYTVAFDLSRRYENPYDPEQIDVQARFLLPSGGEVLLPAFWFQDYEVAAGTERYEQYLPRGEPQWRLRFLPFEKGKHAFRVTARDGSGAVEEAGPFSFDVSETPDPGPVRRHPGQTALLQFTNGTPYLPLGHNLCFEDGNPDLNGVGYYGSLLAAFAASGENWTRLWMTDFSRTALEWGRTHFSGFYDGPGAYSQRASWRVDRFLALAAENGVQVQLVLNDHGQFSTYVNARWNEGNPYGSAQGGPVPQSDPDLFFSDPAARALFKRRLRYLVARWSASPNLLAWELWNEVQFAGTPTRNLGNNAATRAAIVDWHREMSGYLKTQDPFAHLVTTSSDDPGSSSFGEIWNLPAIDMVQSHHYVQPPSIRDERIRQYVASALTTYGKPVIVAEMGVKGSSEPECQFDPEAFLTNSEIPAAERTAANRDHLIAGTTMRNGLWSAAFTRSGAMNWWWGCYIAKDERRNRREPNFPINAHLFPALATFWGGEDQDGLETAAVQVDGPILAYGLQGRARAHVWLRDARNTYGSGWGPASIAGRLTEGAAIGLSNLEPGTFRVSLYSTYRNGGLLAESEISAPEGNLRLTLPPFRGDIALKISRGNDRGWGIVPRSAQTWIDEGDPSRVRAGYALLRPQPGTPTPMAGAILTLKDGGVPFSELAVGAQLPTSRLWTPAEIGAPGNTGLALVNATSQPVNVTLRVSDAEGRLVRTHSFALTAGAHNARFLFEWFEGLAAPFLGTLEVSSDGPIGVLPLRGTWNSAGKFIMTSMPVHDDSSVPLFETLVLPQVADGAGYQTEGLLLNPSDIPLSGKLRFRKQDGSPWTLRINSTASSERDYLIPPRGIFRWTTERSAPEVVAGYALLEPASGQPAPAASAVIRYSPGVLQSESGVPFLTPASTADAYWEVGGDLNLGIAMTNSVDREQDVRLELFLREGAEGVRTAALRLPAGGQIARLLTELFPDLPSASRGYLRCVFGAPGALLPLRMRTTPQGVLYSSLPLPRLKDDRERIFPQVVAGSGYSTQFILANPGSLLSSVRVSFR